MGEGTPLTREELLYLLKHDEVFKEAVLQIVYDKVEAVMAEIEAERERDEAEQAVMTPED